MIEKKTVCQIVDEWLAVLDMGLTPKTRVMVRKRAPLGDPIEIFLRGYELTLRLDDAKKITVQPEEA